MQDYIKTESHFYEIENHPQGSPLRIFFCNVVLRIHMLLFLVYYAIGIVFFFKSNKFWAIRESLVNNARDFYSL